MSSLQINRLSLRRFNSFHQCHTTINTGLVDCDHQFGPRRQTMQCFDNLSNPHEK